MKLLFSTAAIIAFLVTALLNKHQAETSPPRKVPLPITINHGPKIQAAILLDVSNSMDGLIEQAKVQLWNMVSTMGKAQCNGKTPAIEIALYEYGRPANGPANGFVRQLSDFTSDLDQLSKHLFSLKTNGGEEYCGTVIYKSLDQLKWDTAAGNYKVIFIAGNEDFLQGKIEYTRACARAKEKEVIVNTIYCGSWQQGVNEHWNLNDECGNGSYSNINKDARIEEIPTPYDSLILSLNARLNSTYISYGYAGVEAYHTQQEVDKLNFTSNKSAAVKRATVKGKKELYKNNRWDVVDASASDEKFIEKLDRSTLADSLKNKTTAQLKIIVKGKQEERDSIQTEIGKLAVQREQFLAAEKSKKTITNGPTTLETEMEKIIKKQAKLFNMIIP